jgi:hypothetical protein
MKTHAYCEHCAEEVLDRLKATGRDRDALNAQARRFGQPEPLR